MTQSTRDGSQEWQSSSCFSCPLHRLIILHLDLPSMCTDGKSYDEGASLEELSSHILYYHCNSNNSSYVDRSILQTSVAYNTESAVQFAGLVSALYSLPGAVGKEKNDYSTEIHLENSSLVFVPLEAKFHANIVAVAQIARLCPPESNSKISCGNPHATRSSIQRCHELFCLLRGGGVHKRLVKQIEDRNLCNESSSEVSKTSVDCPYPGMKKLFSLRKKRRRLEERLERVDGNLACDHQPLSDELNSLCKELDTLANSLPFQKVQSDLQVHYDAYLGDLSLVASMGGGSCRSLVETIPAPIALHIGLHAFNCVPSQPNSHAAIHMGQTIRSLLVDSETKREQHDPLLLGITTFLHGQLVYTHSSSEALASVVGDGHRSDRYSIPYETSSLLMRYLASHRLKMQQQRRSHNPGSASKPETPTRLGRRFTELSLAGRLSAVPSDTENPVSSAMGRFLLVPPLSMLSTSEETQDITGPLNEKVWAPSVILPLQCIQDSRVSTHYCQARIVMFEVEEGFSFLLYLIPDRNQILQISDTMDQNSTSLQYHAKEQDDAPYKDLLALIAKSLSNSMAFLLANNTNVRRGVPQASGMPSLSMTAEDGALHWDEPGQDIIIVDRSLHRMALFSSRNKLSRSGSSNNEDVKSKKSDSNKTLKRPFWSSATDHIKQQGQPTPSSTRQQSPTRNSLWSNVNNWSAQGLDCRHLLASNLPLDSVLAFDDVMDDVYQIKRRKQKVHLMKNNMSQKFSGQGYLPSHCGEVEICTFMPQGWIYAFAGSVLGRELYVLFDSRLYVTVADVQNAAMKIRKQLLGDLSL